MLVTVNCPQCEYEFPDVSFDPPRSAPPCSNHDSPAFSDPGDPGGIENIPAACPNCQFVISDEWIELVFDDLCHAEPDVDDDYDPNFGE